MPRRLKQPPPTLGPSEITLNIRQPLACSHSVMAHDTEMEH